jgi:hypothetical protein
MPDNDYGYTSQVVVRQADDGEDANKIGHVKAGEQEDFVTGCLDLSTSTITVACIENSSREYRSSALKGFQIRVTVVCTEEAEWIQLFNWLQNSRLEWSNPSTRLSIISLSTCFWYIIVTTGTGKKKLNWVWVLGIGYFNTQYLII